MKVFIHDQKHDRVIGEHEIVINPEVIEAVEKLVNFLNENVTTRYNRLVMAHSYYTHYEEATDSRETIFRQLGDEVAEQLSKLPQGNPHLEMDL